jgi:hypothetical protein
MSQSDMTWGARELNIYTLYVEVIRCNLKDLDHCHVCNCSLTNNISYVICKDIYDLCIKFHVSSYNGSLVITAELRLKTIFAQLSCCCFTFYRKIASAKQCCCSGL